MAKRNSISQTKRQIIFARDAWTCCYCGKTGTLKFKYPTKPSRVCVVPFDEKDREYEIDHIIPVCFGGDNSFNNLITACWECNNTKRDKDIKPKWRMFIVDIK